MKSTASLLLLMVVLNADSGAFVSSTLLNSCPADITIPDHEGVANITTLDGGVSTSLNTNLYVQPKPGFQGISLAVEIPSGGDGGGSEVYISWIPVDQLCLKDGFDWWMMKVEAWISSYEHNTGNCTLYLSLLMGQCKHKCFKYVTFRSVPSLRVTGYGTSAWRLSQPHSSCSIARPRISKETYGSCKSPKTSTQRPDNTTPRDTPKSVTTTATRPTKSSDTKERVRRTLCAESTPASAGQVVVAVMVVLTVAHVVAAAVGLVWIGSV
ncbi:hypothetical protein O3P69_008197 [Scylla paramamosain]|uniref:Uncharacterized protein n=1 Tax=Scylla paramamosain TaxID=85552 RepID=A0AAW0T4A3_SCYPA